MSQERAPPGAGGSSQEKLMKAVQIDRPKHLRMVEAPVPRPAEGQVLVRNLRLSICGSASGPSRGCATPSRAW